MGIRKCLANFFHTSVFGVHRDRTVKELDAIEWFLKMTLNRISREEKEKVLRGEQTEWEARRNIHTRYMAILDKETKNI